MPTEAVEVPNLISPDACPGRLDFEASVHERHFVSANVVRGVPEKREGSRRKRTFGLKSEKFEELENFADLLHANIAGQSS